MENKILKIGMLILSLVIVFSYNDVNADTVDKRGSSCIINTVKSIGIGKTINGYVSCYYDSELSDTIITTNDFSISPRFLGKLKITSVSHGYKNITNEKFYRWDFKMKGIWLGVVDLQLKPGVISDIYGNKNYSSTTAVIKVAFI